MKPMTSVHPHVCGEIVHADTQIDRRRGTSPRLWGDFPQIRPLRALIRYIPTSVGRLPLTSQSIPRRSVHPHVCGEICSHCRLFKRHNGTSPRLWGDFLRHLVKESPYRYIPTSVGRLSWRRCGIISRSVHPHVCGEILFASASVCGHAGTSPRLWGDFWAEDVRPQRLRYIPTSVGRLYLSLPTRGKVTVHPHVCGEIASSHDSLFRLYGTSPRLWGDFQPR